MVKPNEEFHLTVEELEIVEVALLQYQSVTNEPRKVQNLLGKFHNQKHWYVPPDDTPYVSG
jgi:hypothetical protein